MAAATWKCLNCTLLNQHHALQCEACDNPKPHGQDSHDDDSYWMCFYCTYANKESESKERCGLCDSTREHATPTMGGVYANEHDDNENENENVNANSECYTLGMKSLNVAEVQFEYFEAAIDYIVSCPDLDYKSTITVLKSLKKITSRVSDGNPKYRVLDSQSDGVWTKLLGFDGSLEFLQLLGYTLDASQSRLQCLQHPQRPLLDRVISLTETHLKTQRARKKKRERVQRKSQAPPQQQQQLLPAASPVPADDTNEDDDDGSDLKFDMYCGDFTLAQIVGLVTHETLHDDDCSTTLVLLLCHRCFSDSLELMEAIRKRFFVPAPMHASEAWNEEQIIYWCQCIQRPIQQKCISLLCTWITNYFYVDFVVQSDVLLDLHKFREQILECDQESGDDGWFKQCSAMLTSAIENSAEQLAISEQPPNGSHAEEKAEQKAGHGDDGSNVELDLKHVAALLCISYDQEALVAKPKRSKGMKLKLFSSSNNNHAAADGSNHPAETSTKTLLFDFPAIDIAQQLTLVDLEYFNAIHRREFLDKVWKGGSGSGNKPKPPQAAPAQPQPPNYKFQNLQRMIDRFNQIHKYICRFILVCPVLSSRVRILSHFVDVCRHLLELRNFFSLMAVFSALDSVAISKLKYCWLRLDDSHKMLLKNLAAVCDPKQNSKSLRNLMRRAALSRLPSIPYIGVFLSDLTFVNEGAAKKVEGFINFKRFERFNERCKIVQCFQEHNKLSIDLLQKNQLSQYIENDMDVLTHKISDKQTRQLTSDAQANDENSATNAERQKIAKQKQNKRKR